MRRKRFSTASHGGTIAEYGTMSGGFTLDESTYPPGLRMPMHAHEKASFGVVLGGCFTERIGRKTVRACAPLAVILRPPDESHAVTFHNRTPVRIFRVEISKVYLEQVREEARGALELSACFDGGMFVWLALRLLKEFEREDECSASTIESLIIEMLGASSRTENSGAPRATPRWLEQAREMLYESIAAPPSLSFLANEVGVHPVTLAREFRRRYGTTIGEMVRRRRIDIACRAIVKSNAQMNTIAAYAGFYDQSHFTRTFKQLTGLTPVEYRSLHRSR
jgi:AraC family transcriptional regulator